ncbi:MAG: 30S ribosomal protein S6, partial [Lysobacterales bacterium CG_4_9_14_3_um_filter_62_6]
VECSQAVLTELQSAFRFNDAVLRHLITVREDAVSEISIIAKMKDEKPERRRREDGTGFSDAEFQDAAA